VLRESRRRHSWEHFGNSWADPESILPLRGEDDRTNAPIASEPFRLARVKIGRMGSILNIGRSACLLLGWLSLQLSGHVVLCHGEDGHIAVELALHGHCDDRPVPADSNDSISDGAGILAATGCQDTPFLPDTPDHDVLRLLRWGTSRTALANTRTFLLPPLPHQVKGHPPVPDCLSSSLHLAHLRTIILRT